MVYASRPSLLQIQLDNIPVLKAGEVKFQTRVTIDTNGYMNIEYVLTLEYPRVKFIVPLTKYPTNDSPHQASLLHNLHRH